MAERMGLDGLFPFSNKLRSAMGNYGIDYGLGETNIDPETGIRYGVIPQNAVLQSWADSSEPYYGEEKEHEDGDDSADCDCCEPLSYVLDDGEYLAESDSYGDIFVLRSPYYTHAQFCSPCAPGACYLENPTDEGGPRVYCFPPDWFDYWSKSGLEPAGVYLEIQTSCPHPVYRVSDGACVYKPRGWCPAWDREVYSA